MSDVVFQFEAGGEKTVSANQGDNLLAVARGANVPIDAPCSGNGACGKCRVKLVSGEVDAYPTSHISEEEFAEGWRLACTSRILGDVTVMVPDIASAYRSRMKTADLSSGEEIAIFEALQKEIRDSGIAMGTPFFAQELTMDAPTLEDTMPDAERLAWAVQAATGAARVERPFFVMEKMAHVLRENEFHVRVIGAKQGDTAQLYDILPAEDQTPVCGLAVDIGTTTVSAVLMDLETGKLLAKGSAGNGQIRYGADVINRILEQGKEGGRKNLQDAILKETLVPMIANLAKAAAVKVTRIVRVCVASNTTMNHLLIGVDANPVRMEPYIPSFFRWNGLKASDLHLPVHPDAPILLAPNIGSYVGGDITAGTFASMIWNRDAMSLFIDLGTNGEIVFGNRDFLMSCACSAGPAFEGGDISCGMRATDGAIESCRIDPKTMEPTFGIIGDRDQKPVGLCGSGIIDLIAELFRCRMITAKGIFRREGSRVAHDRHGCGRYVLATPEESATGREIALDEVDIDNFIRAKGAIFSAIQTLLTSIDMDVTCIDDVYVAGGIGSGINMTNAVMIGMFPDIPLEKYHYIGNSSLSGAYAMVISDEAEDKVYEVARNMTYLELSTTPGYMDEFVAACFLPHTNGRMFPSCKQEDI
ncbi:MAG: corrinoid activation/regeneration protein AcsV [Oscillospiraceae bacterium]|nr:corrinoid activation/regeneration protein AcsV [Oscillospiraceae bacterium]